MQFNTFIFSAYKSITCGLFSNYFHFAIALCKLCTIFASTKKHDMNIEKKYTDGEWLIDGQHITTGFDPKDETICDINPVTEYPTIYSRDRLEATANAQLISQAPRMAEMLIEQYKEALEEFEFYTKINETDQIIYWQNKAAQIKEVLTAAGIVITE